MQLTGDVPPEELFWAGYPYFSSFSDQLLAHSREHALRLIDERALDERSLVIEVGSNDGYLLRHFAERGIPVLGIDPSPRQAEAAERAGVRTRCEFFSPELASEVLAAEGRPADVILANNVLAHTPEPNGFAEGFARLLADDGLLSVENPSVRELIAQREFDTIYHEHFSYLSCSSVAALMARHGLTLARVERFALHGGTLRWYLGRDPVAEESARACLAAEADEGVTGFDFYAAFGADVEELQQRLGAMLQDVRGDGSRIAAYGAAAKGSTLLNSIGAGREVIDYVVDRNVHKQGLLMPGVHVPIRDPLVLLEDRPEFLLLLAWNFKDEVIRQQAEYARGGGRFIVPLPEPAIVDGTGRAETVPRLG